MIYLISDLHLFHDRAFIYKPRGFECVADMNATIIDNWNKTIKPDDDVYVIGDFALGSDFDLIRKTISALPGRIHLIIGNHDTDKKIELYHSMPNMVEIVYATTLTVGNRKLYLSHYQTLTASLETSPDHAIYNIHGHIHTKDKFTDDNPYFYNVCCDAHDCMPVSVDKVLADIWSEIIECRTFLEDPV